MRKHDPIISVITPTTGKNSLMLLQDSIRKQGVPVEHILLWDNIRQDEFMNGNSPSSLIKPNDWDDHNMLVTNIEIPYRTKNGLACGSALRAIGLMAAQTEFVTFADDDVIWEDDHLISMIEAIQTSNWAFCKRRIWAKLGLDKYEYLGIDEFESIGEESKLDYKMIDNNCVIFRRRFGSSAACLYRETKEYNDDRLFYQFMMKYAGKPNQTGKASINQVCPPKLYHMFKESCTMDKHE